jgi:hypothetical protein
MARPESWKPDRSDVMQPLAMRFFVCAFVSAGVSAGLVHAGEITAKVPDQPLEIHLTVDGFEPDSTLASDRSILAGRLASGAVLTVLCEANMPYLSGKECRESRKGSSGFEAFAVGDVAACKFRTVLRENVTTTDYYAWPVTPDYLFVLHASTTSVKSGTKPTFDKSAFEKLTASFRVTGTVDRSTWIFPREVYEFRDAAAQHADGQLAWVTKECETRPDDSAAHFYLGTLGSQHQEPDLSLRGFARAAELLASRATRTPQEDQALFQALDREGGAQFQRKRYREALAACQRLAEFTAGSAHAKAPAFRAQALYNVALCHAQTGEPALAIESLRQAIALEPTLKRRATEDDFLKPLRSKKDFKALVDA